MTKYTYTSWDQTPDTTRQIFHLMYESYPLNKRFEAHQEVSIMEEFTRAYPHSNLVVSDKGQVVAFALLSEGPNPQTLRLGGAVSPQVRRQGLGTELFNRLMNTLKESMKNKQLVCPNFESSSAGKAFLEALGFSKVESLCWSRFDVTQSLPEWVNAKVNRVQNSGYQIISAQEYKSLRSDWDQAWWTLDVSTFDVPSNIKMEPISFEKWEQYMTKQLDLSRIFLVLHLLEPIASIRLSALEQGVMNIDFTGVHPNYRRQGISTALKAFVIKEAHSLGAEYLSTQNHYTNPILDLNLRLGFIQQDVLNNYSKMI